MKRIYPAALAALMVGACADADPAGLGPDTAGLAPDATASAHHTWQAGNGSAWHGYTAPDVVYAAADGLVCATWTDDYLDEFLAAEGMPDADHFSFDFLVFDEVENDWVELGDVNAKESDGDRTSCFDVSEWENGSYLFEVVGMAKSGTGQETTTHHTDAWSGAIVIGEVEWSIVPVGGNVEDLIQNANTNNFTLEYELYYGDDLVTDCEDMPEVSWDGTVHNHTCDTDGRGLILRNPDRGTVGSWTLGFHWGDPEEPFTTFQIESD